MRRKIKRFCPGCGCIYECWRTKRHRICAGCEIALRNDPSIEYGLDKRRDNWSTNLSKGE